MIVDIGKETIDLSKLERIGYLWEINNEYRYRIFFVSGESITIYDSKQKEEDRELNQIPRVALVKLWKQSKTK